MSSSDSILTAYGVNQRVTALAGSKGGYAPLDSNLLIPLQYLCGFHQIKLTEQISATRGGVKYKCSPLFNFTDIKPMDILVVNNSNGSLYGTTNQYGTAIILKIWGTENSFCICAISGNIMSAGFISHYMIKTDSTYGVVFEEYCIPSLDYIDQYCDSEYLHLSDADSITEDCWKKTDIARLAEELRGYYETLCFDAYMTGQIKPTSFVQNSLNPPNKPYFIAYLEDYKRFYAYQSKLNITTGTMTITYYGRWPGCEKFGIKYGSDIISTDTSFATSGVTPFTHRIYVCEDRNSYIAFNTDIDGLLPLSTPPIS